MKFFQHDYSKEDAATRLQRLEKLVFGDARSGDPDTRLKNLLAAVPNLDAAADQPATADNGSQDTSPAPSYSQPSGRTAAGRQPKAVPARPVDDDIAQNEQQISGSSQYPAVSAIEKKLLGRDFGSEAIVKRLDRLETKVFGQTSASTDLSDRVDRLKAKTGVDLAAAPPPGTDWADDDTDTPRGGGDITYVPADTTPFRSSRTPATNLGGSPPVSGGSGTYGSRGGNYPLPSYTRPGYGGSSASAGSDSDSSGSYGFNPPSKRLASATPTAAPPGMPQPAPDVVREPLSAPPTAVGLNQRVTLIENELFNKTYPNDPLPSRVSRIESTVFPGKRASGDMSLPERVNRIADALEGRDPVRAGSSRVAQRGNDDNIGSDPAMPRPAPARGLSKLINGLGNLIGGGGAYGAYPMGSNLVTDPQTGMLVDMYSGNVIDPRSGAVIGNRSTGMTSGSYGTPYSGFNNGLSPLGSSYGTGMRFGSGMRFGGMGFGSGMGGLGVPGFGGMGMWP